MNLIPQAKAKKEKTNTWDNIKLKIFYTAKETINKVKRQPTVWEKIFLSHIPDKGLISKIHKELIQLNSKKKKKKIQFKNK